MTVTEVTRNSATISWLPPDVDGGAAISAYIIEKRELSSDTWSRVTRLKPFSLSYTVTGECFWSLFVCHHDCNPPTRSKGPGPP